MAGFEIFAVGKAGSGLSRRFWRNRRCLGPGQVAGICSWFLSIALWWSLHQALGQMLINNKSLKELDLCSCQVGDVGAQAPGFSILKPCWLMLTPFPLDFDICFLQALANALQDMEHTMPHIKTLTNLDLGGNEIGDKGIEARVLLSLKALFFHFEYMFAACRL